MTSFEAAQHYSAPLVLLAGLAGFLGLMGVGDVALRVLRVRLPTPWREVASTLLGIELVSLAVQLLGMAGWASRPVLLAIAAGTAVAALRPLGAAWHAVRARGVEWRGVGGAAGTILLGALAINLLVAAAPSTKIDELYYHLVTPGRIAIDGALRFYRMPWEAAVYGHMLYQIAMAPLHALAIPDAAAVVGWALYALLVWFAARLLLESSAPRGWTALWLAALVVGLYSTVWTTTGGSHSMGNLGMAAAVVGLGHWRSLQERVTPPALGFLFSVLILAAVASKISLLPLGGFLLLAVAYRLAARATPGERGRVAGALLAPWLALWSPILIWSWAHSGSPFGPLFTGVFGTTAYDGESLRRMLDATTAMHQGDLLPALRVALASYSPLVWIAISGFLGWSTLPRGTRVLIGAAFLFQAAVIVARLPFDLRYTGGAHYGLLILFALTAPAALRASLSRGAPLHAAGVLLLLPWLGAQLYYARPFLETALGITPPREFLARYVPLYEDFVRLDRLLPAEAVLMGNGSRLASAYAPRPVIEDPVDRPPGAELYLLATCAEDLALLPPPPSARARWCTGTPRRVW